MTTTQQCSQSAQTADDSTRQLEEQLLRDRMEKIGHKLLVLSGKGGVGKSTLAANLAVALASQGKTVGLLDIDLHGPSIPRLLGLEGQTMLSNGEELIPVRMNDRLKVVSIGFLVREETDAVIWRGPRKFGAIRQFLMDVAWGRLDYLVVDAPPGTGDEPMAIAQLIGRPAGAVIVTTPQEIAVSDVRRCVSFCREVSLPIVGIVENMSGLACPRCGETIDLFKTGGGEALAAEMRVPFLGKVPFEPGIVTSGDAGEPFIDKSASIPASKAFADIVLRIQVSQKPGGAAVRQQNQRQEAIK